MSKPLAIDLCCGRGGWTAGLLAEGWRVVGFDLVKPTMFPIGAQFVQQDIQTISGIPFRGRVALVVASPPCTEFSQCWNFARHGCNGKCRMFWARGKGGGGQPEPVPVPLTIVRAA